LISIKPEALESAKYLAAAQMLQASPAAKQPSSAKHESVSVAFSELRK